MPPPLSRPAQPPRRPRGTIILQPQALAHLRDLQAAGRNREALETANQIGPLECWAGGPARLLAGELAQSMGAPRLAAALHLRAWRRSRNDYDALAAGLKVLLERRGPWAAWERLRPLNLPEGKQAPPAVCKLWLLRAQVAGSFRDFETAERFWQTAEAMAPRLPAVQLVRAALLEREDRLEEALACARRALDLAPHAAAPVALTAHLLQKAERDEESLALLQEATRRMDSVPLLAQLATLQSALELHHPGLETLDQLWGLSSILEKDVRLWVLRLRLQLAWRAGEEEMALAAARQLGEPAALQFIERASAPATPRRRVQLDVPFVAQQHDTCAPATMAALSRFWQRPLNAAAVAGEITYGGTSALKQREWLEQNGWKTRPFTLTWEAACALLDRGVPFELSTLEATSGHAQAVCGYDAVQQTLLIRDSNFRHLRQVPAEPFLTAYRANGPTAMVMVPLDKAGLLENLELPDEPLHELLHQVWAALERHDREAAHKAATAAQTLAPGHWLALRAHLTLAYYDGDLSLVLEILEQLLEKFPEDPRLLSEKLSSLAGHERREERLGLLARLCGQSHPHPLFLLRYAQELGEDARRSGTASRWVRQALRRGQMEGGLGCLASLFWRQRRFEEALELYRFSTCLADTQEAPARQYFNAACYLNRSEPALQFLRNRFERFGRKSPHPALSLCAMLETLGRQSEARAVLQAAQQLLPENAALDFHAAQVALREGQPEQARALLDRAHGRISLSDWRRVSARISEQRGELASALETWRELLATEPHSAEAHAALAQLLAQLEGRPAALRHLEQACARFPWHIQLHRLWFSWQQEEDLLAAEPIIERLIALNPRDAEAHRQKARILLARGKFEPALQSADTAVQLEPTHSQSHAARARVLLSQGQLAAAQEAFRRAVSLAVDYGEFMAELLQCCKTAFDRRLVLDFIRSQLGQNLVYGDGILAFRELARGQLPPHELLQALRQLANQRPDLWHASAALIRELASQGELKEALKVAQSALERLPEAAALWDETARLHQCSRSGPAELAAREKVLQLSPGDPGALCRLAEALERLEQAARAKTLLEEALLQQPRLSAARLLLARMLWREDKRDHALEQLKQALRASPDNERAWSLLADWGRAQGQPDLALETAQRLCQTRSQDPAVWLRLAHLLWAREQTNEALEAVEKALQLHPRHLEACDLRISLLLRAERLDEALTACRPEPWGAQVPPMLQVRHASVLYARGDHAGAIAHLEKALEETPTLLWGWRLLGSWHLAEGRQAAAEAVAQRLLELGAQDADSYFWVAQMKLSANETAEGVDLLEKALEFNPDHLPCRVRLMYAQLSTNQFNALEDTLRHLQRQGAADWVCVCQIALALRRGAVAPAFEHLERLLQVSWAEERAVLNAIRSIKEHGATVPLEKLLRQRLTAPAPRLILGPLWVEVCLKQGQLPRAAHVLHLGSDPGLRRRVLQSWLEGIHSLPQTKPLDARFRRRRLLKDLRRFEKAECEWFRTDAEAWSSYGAALAGVHAYKQAWRWFADWKERPVLQRWALYTIMNVLSSQGRFAEAIEAGVRALAQPANQRAEETRLMLAWLEANAGQAEQARQRLAGLEPDSLSQVWRVCLDVINAAIVAGTASPGTAQSVARAELAKLRAARNWRGIATWQLCFRRLFRQSVYFLAAKARQRSACFWVQRMTWNWPWSARR